MFKVRGQRWRSQGQRSRLRRKVMYQQQKRYNTAKVQRRQTWHGVVIKAGKDWRDSGGLKLQCIRSCHVYRYSVFARTYTGAHYDWHAEDSTKLASANNYTSLVCMIRRRSLTVAWFKCPYTNKVRGGRHSVLESISTWTTIILNYAKYVHKCKYYLHELRSVSNVGSVTYLHCVNHDQLMVFSTQIPLFAHSSKHEVLSRNTQSNNQSQATTHTCTLSTSGSVHNICKV